MLVKKDMTSYKSKDTVIRSICCEFNHFSIDQMDMLKYIISEYMETNDAVYTKGTLCVGKVGNDFIDKHLINEGVKIYDELSSLLDIEVHLFGKPIKKCVVYVRAPLSIGNIDAKHIKQCVIRVVKKVSNDIFFILSKIDNVKTKENYFFQEIAIWDGDFYGQYDFGVMKVDFGKSNRNRVSYKVARCLIRYTQYKIDLENYPTFSYIERNSKMYLTLLQFFLRFPIYEPIGDVVFIPSDSMGIETTVDRSDFRTDYIVDYINNNIVPNDIQELFLKYEHLSEIEKGVFFNAIDLYCEGVKSEDIKAISYFVICLETIANHEAKKNGLKNINKIDMISWFLQMIFQKCRLSHQSIEELYSIRSAYVHNGIANNDFLDEIFMKSLVSSSHREIVERIANFALIRWLMKT